MARWVNGQCGHHTAADLGQHIVDSRTRQTQQTRGQTDAGQQRNGRERRAALLEDHGELDRPKELSRSAAGTASSRPAEVDDRLPHRAPAHPGSVIACRAIVGGHSVRRTSRTLSRSDSCSEFSPTSIRPLT